MTEEQIAELRYEAGMYKSLYENAKRKLDSLWVCTGCGSMKSIEQIKGEHPQAIACCPEREMRPQTQGFQKD